MHNEKIPDLLRCLFYKITISPVTNPFVKYAKNVFQSLQHKKTDRDEDAA